MSKRYDSSKQWYAIHTYSGYEEKVAESIRQRAESLDMGDKIFQVLVPKEKMIEIKNGKRKVVEPDGLLSSYELADRVCGVFGCPHYEHLSIPQEVA